MHGHSAAVTACMLKVGKPSHFRVKIVHFASAVSPQKSAAAAFLHGNARAPVLLFFENILQIN